MIRLSFFLLLVANSLAQTNYSPAVDKILQLLNDDFFTSSGVSLSIYDLTEHRSILDTNSTKLLRPGSNMKILTSAAALLFLGEDYKFRTSLFYTGNIVNGNLYGDVYIKGGCDPDFTSKDLDSLIGIFNVKGIREISGDIYLDLSMKDSLFWGNGWMWDDDPSTDAPYLSALNINDNAIKIFAKPGPYLKPGSLRTEPVTSYINIVNQTLTAPASSEPLIITRDWLYRTNTIKAMGNISPADSETAVILSIFGPEHYFAHLFLENLRTIGVKNKENIKFGQVPEHARNLTTFDRSFDTVLVNLNKISDNLSAEMVLYAMAAKFHKYPATAKNGLQLVDSLVTLTGKDPSNYVYVDGSGVSHYNLISSDLIISILNYMYFSQNPLFKKLYNSFPVAGKDGTLRNRMRGTTSENNVHAKTGTLSAVSSLSGYLTTAGGNFLSFSILIQNYNGSAGKAKYFQDQICNILTSF